MTAAVAARGSAALRGAAFARGLPGSSAKSQQGHSPSLKAGTEC